ncbi:hypothetical protein HHK36_000260 [Tetracentron sinense]|uniref:Uncharacterized protein n=1 Tax=Tetracentron sinense TaxID=13715 RepID=A0A834ZRA4_TETSI|nr:hypothetical protein HHK36_000260 [Tetracentron sinense]
MDFYDISLVDGFNLPMDFSPTTGNCRGIRCSADINEQCPNELKAAGGCNNPCTVFKTDEYCCNSGTSCGPTTFSKFFKDSGVLTGVTGRMGRSSNWCTPLLSKLKKLSRWSWTGTGSPENEVGGGATALGQMLPWRWKSSCAAVSGVGISPEVWQSQSEKKGATGSVARWCRCHELDGGERDAVVELIPPVRSCYRRGCW